MRSVFGSGRKFYHVWGKKSRDFFLTDCTKKDPEICAICQWGKGCNWGFILLYCNQEKRKRYKTMTNTTVNTFWKVQVGYNRVMHNFKDFNDAKTYAKTRVNNAKAQGLNVYVVRVNIDYVNGTTTKYYKIFA